MQRPGTEKNPHPPFFPLATPAPLTILKCCDVERLAAVVSCSDSCVCLNGDAVVGVLPQMRDVDVVGR